MEKLGSGQYSRHALLLAAGALLVSGCSINVDQSGSAVSPSSSVGTTQTPPLQVPEARLHFDALGGNRTIVQVFPLGSDGHIAENNYGTYPVGEHVGVDCQRTDREVNSQSPETPRHSSTWYHITGTDFFAPGTYAKLDPPGAVLPTC